MLEIFKALLETVSKLLDPLTLSKLVKEKRKEELGAKLFMRYVVIDEICLDGEAMVADLEDYVGKMSRYLANERERWALSGLKCIGGISAKAQRQLGNLSKLEHVLGEVATELRIVDPIAYRKLKLLCRGYFSSKAEVLRFFNLAPPALSEGHLPLLGPTVQDLLDAAEELAGSKPLGEKLDTGEFPREPELEEAVKSRIREVQELYRRGPVVSGLWDESAFAMVKEYLASRDPRKQLAEVRAVADHLRSTLEKVFALSDILWLVGTRKFRSRYGPVAP